MSIKDKIKKLSESPSYDFNHIDPVTGLPRVKTRPEDKIHLMNQMPAKSGFIVMLQNRVNFNSIGNKRYSETLWYDRNTRKVSKEKDGIGGVDFRVYHLPNGPKPQGWVYKEEIGRLNEDFFDELSNDLEEPIDDIELLDEGVEKTYKHYASYVLQTLSAKHKTTIADEETLKQVLDRVHYCFKRLLYIKEYRISIKVVCDSMDIWPYQTRTTHTTFSDKLKTVVYNNEFDYDEIKKLYHEKAACGRSTITSELCIEYNFKDNVTLKEIQKFTEIIYKLYKNIRNYMHFKHPKIVSFAILFDDEYQKSMQTDVLNGDVFKKAFGIIAKKELGVDRMTKEMSNVCKEFSDKYNGQFKMPFNIIHFMQTKYKKSVYPKFIGFVASSGAVVTQNDDEQCYDIVVSGKAMCEQMRHILHYLAQFCRMNDQFRYYGINLVSNGTLTLRNEMQVAVSQVSRKIAKLEFLGNASYYVFQFVRHANVEELILHTDFNTEFTNREAFEYKLLQESKNKNIKVTYFV